MMRNKFKSMLSTAVHLTQNPGHATVMLLLLLQLLDSYQPVM